MVAKCYEEFIRLSPLDPCILFHEGGHWREITETTMTRCSNEDSPYQLLYGKSHIYEEVLGSKFRISADAFFQVNTEAAEVLYHTVRELCLAKEEDTVLDVCCGTGVIGIILSSKVKKVIGIEVIEQAVKDANHNASLNGVLNCEPFRPTVAIPVDMFPHTTHCELVLVFER
ncbi:tRNA (uracil(54)-C(5))-methyltransferase B-like [Arapaima gigas]